MEYGGVAKRTTGGGKTAAEAAKATPIQQFNNGEKIGERWGCEGLSRLDSPARMPSSMASRRTLTESRSQVSVPSRSKNDR
jgi:hypothetical protein